LGGWPEKEALYMNRIVAALAALLLAWPASAQTIKTYDQFTAASSVASSDLIAVYQGANPLHKATGSQVAAMVLGLTTGDCTYSTYAITCTKTGGVSFGTFATQSVPTGSTQCLQANSSGVVSGTAAPCGGSGSTGANPTATASDTAVNGVATTFMRSDAAPAIQKGTSSVFGVVKVDGSTITSTGGVISASGGGGSLTTTDGTHSVASTTQVTFGNGFLVGGTTPNATVSLSSTVRTKTASYSVAAADMGNALTLAATSGTPALTLSAVSSTIFSPGMTLSVSVPKITSGVSWTVTNSTGLTLRGLNGTTLLPGTQGTFVANNDGTTLDFFPGSQIATTSALGSVIPDGTTVTINGAGVISAPGGGSGTVTTTGTPASGKLAGFSGATSITNVDLTGDCTTSGALATTCALKVTPLATGTSVTLVAPRGYYVCTSTCTVTVPVPAAGYEFCVRNGNNVSTVITLAAIGSSARYENTANTAYGTAGTGTFVSGGAVGDKICIVGLDSTHYLTLSYNGTWTAS
jgi:hypothetical protein